MAEVRVKFCGLQSAADVAAAVAAGADAVGFVLVPGSRRQVDPAAVRRWLGGVTPFVTPVAVCADQSLADVVRLVEAAGVRTVQLAGAEDPDYAARLAAMGLRVLKVLHMDGPCAWQAGRGYRDCSGFVLDAASQFGPGGSGQAFPWQWAAQAVAGLPAPVILAGGLRAGNVARAVAEVRPYAVDVSSGVEENGQKTLAAMRSFCRAVREGAVAHDDS